MKKYLIAFGILVLVACQRNEHNWAPGNWISNYNSAFRRADVEAILSGFSDDIIYCPPNQPSFSGKENLRRWLLAYFNYYSVSEYLLGQDREVRGDLAYVTFTYSVKAKVKYSDEVIQDAGKLINIFKRGSFGKWICIYSIWNSNNSFIDLHAQIPADFSGTWILDLSRSTEYPNLISSKILIIQKGNELNITRLYELKNQKPVTNSMTYSIGREIKTVTEGGSKTTTSFWSTDKQSFTINEKLLTSKNNKSYEYNRTTVYSITAKGETLNVIADQLLPQESFIGTNDKNIDLTYNRK